MAKEKRSVALMAQIPALPSNNPRGRGRSVTDRVLAPLVAAFPVFQRFQEAKTEYETLRVKSVDRAIAEAAAIFALDVNANVLKLYPDAEPENVFADSYKTQWSIVKGALVKMFAPKGADKDQLAETAKQVQRMGVSWSRARLVMWHAGPKALVAYSKGSYPVPLQEAYNKAREKENAGKAPSQARLEAMAEKINAYPLAARRIIATMIEGVQVTLPTIKTAPKTKKAAVNE